MFRFRSLFCGAAAFSLISPVIAGGDDQAALQSALKAIDPEIKPEQYTVARADLDSDGRPDFLVYMGASRDYCGSGGCTLFVLRATAGAPESLGSVAVVNPPIYLRAAKHNGYRELLVRVAGGGAEPGFAVLRFDGKAYPRGAGEIRGAVDAADVVLIADPAASPAGPEFRKSLKLQDVAFEVQSKNLPAGNTVTITPAGLELDNSPVVAAASGRVTGAEVADLNADGSPELYIYVSDPAANNRGSLIAFAANRRKSLSQITLPLLTENDAHAKGYRGMDEFSVLEGELGRRFPIFGAGDAPKPTGKTRQLQYRLLPGEATWQLKVHKVVEF